MESVETPSSNPTISGSSGTTAVREVVAEVREGTYGDRVATIEPGGAGYITDEERHGKPINLFWTWLSPNLEFATIFVGVIAVLFFGLTFWQAVSAIVLGTGLGAFTQVILAARGPELGAPQMIVSRIPFGFRGNILPAGLNSLVAGVGWFAVNSVSGAFALNSLINIPKPLALLIIAVVQIGDRVPRAQPHPGLRALRVHRARHHLRDHLDRHPEQVAPRRPVEQATSPAAG